MAGSRVRIPSPSVVDTSDVTPRQEVNATGKRIQAVPFSGGTTIVVRSVDFENAGIEHPDVTWDYRTGDFTVEVGKAITAEAADLLVNKFPDSFRFVGG